MNRQKFINTDLEFGEGCPSATLVNFEGWKQNLDRPTAHAAAALPNRMSRTVVVVASRAGSEAAV